MIVGTLMPSTARAVTREVGFEVGGYASRLRDDLGSNPTENSHLGLAVGPLFRLGFSPRLQVQSGVLFCRRGGAVDTGFWNDLQEQYGYRTVEITLDYLEIPVVLNAIPLKYDWWSLEMGIGPTFGILLRSSYTYDTPGLRPVLAGDLDHPSSLSSSVTIGLGVTRSISAAKIGIQSRFGFGVGDIFNRQPQLEAVNDGVLIALSIRAPL